MIPTILLSLLNPSLWAQLIRVANEVSSLVNHPTVVGIAQAVSDTARAAAAVAPSGNTVLTAVISGAEAGGAAVAATYSDGQPSNVAASVVAGVAGAANAAVAAIPVAQGTLPLPGAPT